VALHLFATPLVSPETGLSQSMASRRALSGVWAAGFLRFVRCPSAHAFPCLGRTGERGGATTT
jgi:hypothetical protein